MKKILAFLLVFVLLLSFAACNPAGNDDGTTEGGGSTADPDVTTEEPKPEGVMSYAEYVAAEKDSAVVIEAYVQATQGWWSDEGQGKITVYLADRDGAYFAYEMACEEADAAKLTQGTKIRVSGYKTEWMGEVEIIDATFTLVENADTYVAEAYDVTELLASDSLIDYQNRFVSFSGMTVEAIGQDEDGNDLAYFYNWDNSGSEGNDLYFKVSVNGAAYTFTVESYLTGADSDVYKAVKELKVGDKINMEGFLYWYEGVNPHITAVTSATAEGVMSYDEYMAAEVDDAVTVEAYVQATQGWWSDEGQGKITVYLADRDGAYFAYEMACTEADAAKLTKGTKIRVSGYKAEWMGEVEIMDGTFEFIDGADTYVAEAYDVTAMLSSDMLIEYQNRFVSFKGMTVESMGQDANGNDIVFFYNWDNSGTEGNDLYFKVSIDENVYTFTVESYLTGADSDVYKAVKELKVGDKIDMEGFLYWYEGVNPHITSVTPVAE